MASQAMELTVTATTPLKIDLTDAYLINVEAATADLRLSFERDGFGTSATYRTLTLGSGLVLDLLAGAESSMWVRGDSNTAVARVVILR